MPPQINANRKTGWVKDRPDPRDYSYEALKALSPAPLPAHTDLRSQCSPVEDQGNIGSCTAQALVGNLEFLMWKSIGVPDVHLSRLFVYYNERKIEGTIFEDAGAQIRDGIKTLVDDGVCEEILWPYDVQRFMDEPTLNAYEAAKTRRVLSYHRIDNLDDMLHCLADGFPFVTGFTVFTSFMSDQVMMTGVVSMPRPCEKATGGHAVMVVGYDLAKKIFIVRNSWGTAWGVDGYFTIPFEYIIKHGRDFWTIRL